MAWDLALDPNTGDLVFAANIDLQAVEGDQVVAQRIRNRIRIERGWDFDPTNGTLGSRVKSGTRMNVSRAIVEVPLLIREALTPMTDISINSITAEQSQDDPRQLLVNIDYEVIDEADIRPVDQQAVQDQITIQLTV